MEETNQIEELFRLYKEMGAAKFGILGSLKTDAKFKSLRDNFTKEDVQEWFKNPEEHESEIRDFSRYLYISKGIYYTAINFYTNLPTLDYNVVPMFYEFNERERSNILNSKQKAANYCDDILDKSVVRSILKAVLKDSCYYGYEIKSGQSYYLQRLPNDYCREGKLINGLPSIEFDFSFFDGQEDRVVFYPAEFKKRYEAYKNDKTIQWQTLNHNYTLCIPLESEDFNFPALTGIFDDLIDLDDYYKYMKETTALDTEKVVTQKPPMNEDTGRMLVNPDVVQFFQTALASVFDDRFKVVSTPFELDVIDFTKSKMSNSGFDGVEKMKSATWNGTGIAKPVFGETDSASGLKVNYEINASFVFAILEKFERWLKQRLKKVTTKKYPFKVEFLRTTNVYRKDTFDMYYKLLSIGGAISPVISSMGMNPESYIKILQLENMEGIKDYLQVPSSMHTQPSGDGEDGSPSKGDDEIGDAGEQTRDGDGNVR